MKPRLIPTWLCVLSSHLLFGVLWGLAMHVRLGLGRWPRPMWDKYATAAFEAHFHVLQAVGLATVYGAIPIWFLLLCFRRFRGTLKLHLLQAVVYGLGWGVIGLWCLVDPWKFLQWLAD